MRLLLLVCLLLGVGIFWGAITAQSPVVRSLGFLLAAGVIWVPLILVLESGGLR